MYPIIENPQLHPLKNLFQTQKLFHLLQKLKY